jgi:hypothetical protein
MHGLLMSNPTVAERKRDMALTQVEKERISDMRLKLQSAANSLKHIDAKKIPDHGDIKECLEDADKSLGSALRSPRSNRT